ncbi:MAG: helix-turn-helix transcriptional regulator [Ginsengibacter sp.]
MYGERIRRFRKQKGHSQADIANILHMSPATYSKIETNRTHLTANILGKISEILEISPLAIMKYDPTITNINNNSSNNGTFNGLINAETIYNYQKDFINMIVKANDLIVKAKDAEISTLKQANENQQKIIQQLLLKE